MEGSMQVVEETSLPETTCWGRAVVRVEARVARHRVKRMVTGFEWDRSRFRSFCNIYGEGIRKWWVFDQRRTIGETKDGGFGRGSAVRP